MNHPDSIDLIQALALLDAIHDPVLFADCDHRVRYLNRAAAEHYSEGYRLLNSNLLECHNETSQRMMIDILDRMLQGLDEELITDNEKQRIFMRAVRDVDGKLLGYFERYEPPAPPSE